MEYIIIYLFIFFKKTFKIVFIIIIKKNFFLIDNHQTLNKNGELIQFNKKSIILFFISLS